MRQKHLTFNIQHSTFNIELFARALLAILALACAREPQGSTIKDDLGRPVELRGASRVITLAPNVTEIVFAIGAGNKVVAADDYSDTPVAAGRLPRVGGLQPNVEKIASLRPDLVIATTNGNHPSLAPALAAANIPLFVVRTDRLDEIPTSMRRLGEILDATGAAETAEALRVRVKEQRRSRARAPRVLFLVWGDPLYVAGKLTFSDDLLTLTGAENVVPLNGWPQYSLEALVASPPDLILYPDRSVSREQVERVLGVISQRGSGFSRRGKKIVVQPVDENLFTRPGPRVADAAAVLNAILDRWERGGEVR